jgi:hypothetical protein
MVVFLEETKLFRDNEISLRHVVNLWSDIRMFNDKIYSKLIKLTYYHT